MSLEDTILNYLKEVQSKAGSESYVPHPLIKALMIAFEAANSEQEDGNYAGVSGDADLSPDHQARIQIRVIIEKTGEKFRILSIDDIATGKRIPNSKLERIVHSETLIEKYNALDIPFKNFASILGDTAEITVSILQEPDEVMNAVRFAQDNIRKNKAQGLSAAIEMEILHCGDVRAWRGASSLARSFVGTIWAMETKVNLVMTPIEDCVPKWKARQIIMQVL